MARIFITLCAMLLLTACRPREAEPKEGNTGSLTCKLNGNEWTRLFSKGYQWVSGINISKQDSNDCLNEYATIGSALYNKQRVLEYELAFLNVPLLPGKYSMTLENPENCNDSLTAGRLYTTYDGDVAGDAYYSIPAAGAHVSVESYDEKSKVVKGSFKMVAVIGYKGPGHYLPDTLHFTDGRFEIRLKE